MAVAALTTALLCTKGKDLRVSTCEEGSETPQNGLSDYLEDARVICPIDGAQERVTGYHAEDGRIILEVEST